MDEFIKYTKQAFAQNVIEKKCLYITGGTKGPDEICTRDQKPDSAYCAEHHELCILKKKVNIEDIIT
jgi:hypothetical protein